MLERIGAPLGIVTAIVGQARGEVVFTAAPIMPGRRRWRHATTRSSKAAAFVLHVRDAARPGTVATVGRLEVEPGVANVVPERVTLSVDARASTTGELDDLVVGIGFEPSRRHEPVAMSGAPLAALRAAAPGAPELVSGAGHDAAILGAAGVPTGMLFVRSLNGGVSHSPAELSSEADIALGIDALTSAFDTLART